MKFDCLLHNKKSCTTVYENDIALMNLGNIIQILKSIISTIGAFKVTV